MQHMKEPLAGVDWNKVTGQLHENGYAIARNILSLPDCATLIKGYDDATAYRKTVVMERYRFGSGEYKYFNYPLPELLEFARATVYPYLVPVANSWMNMLGIDTAFPAALNHLQTLCRRNQQVHPTVLILKYGKGGHNTMHQDVYGDIYFPVQLVFFLNEPELDYTGGEFVLMQQTPRAQSTVKVLQPRRGDMLLFATRFRPVKGNKGYYRATMKHGVSEVHHGVRHTLGVIFHDALT